MKVDPFIAPIPEKILKDPQLRPFFEYLVRWAHDIWIRTGGATDEVEENSTRETYPWVLEDTSKDVFNYSVTEVYRHKFRAISANIDYEAVAWDWINAKKKTKITFPKYPKDGDELIVRNGDGSLIGLKGNGRNINGSGSGQIRLKGTSIRFKYFMDSNEWFAI